uniref:Uncharacterized protein n=1 Tax=Pyramimonas obovata TaxID=1411642 RepID=A0A7S0WF61_9CHLO
MCHKSGSGHFFRRFLLLRPPLRRPRVPPRRRRRGEGEVVRLEGDALAQVRVRAQHGADGSLPRARHAEHAHVLQRAAPPHQRAYPPHGDARVAGEAEAAEARALAQVQQARVRHPVVARDVQLLQRLHPPEPPQVLVLQAGGDAREPQIANGVCEGSVCDEGHHVGRVDGGELNLQPLKPLLSNAFRCARDSS